MRPVRTRPGTKALTLGLIGGLCFAGTASADTLHVTSGADSGPGSLRQVVLDAQPSGDVIVIDASVPQVVLNTQIMIDKSLTIQGQGANATEIAATGATRLFAVGTVTSGIAIRIEKVKVSGGRAPNGLPGTPGTPGFPGTPAGPGGAGENGGAIVNGADQLDLVDIVLTDNAAGNGGAGGPDASSSFPGGSGGSGGKGGAILNGGTLTISNSVLTGNDAGVGGGGGFSTFIPGANGAAGDGGAIANSGTLTISDSTLSGNHAAAGGLAPFSFTSPLSGSTGGSGGAIFNSGTLAVTRSTLSGNTAGNGGNGSSGSTPGGGGGAGGNGGAIFISGGAVRLTNSTLSGNAGGNGGAGGSSAGMIGGVGGQGGSGGALGAIGGSSIAIAASTFARNAAGGGGVGGTGPPDGAVGGGGGGGAINSIVATVTVHGSLLAGNSAAGSASCGTGVTDDGGNVASPDAGGCPAGFAVGDAKLDPAGLANNGGPTQTIALLSGSAAIDAVSGALCTDADGAPLATDQRGVARPPAGGCDAGAFEFVPVPKARLTRKPRRDLVKTKKNRAKVTFAFTSDIAGATFECKLNRGAFGACSSPKRYWLKRGRHIFQVRAIDAGGTGPAASVPFKVKKIRAKHHRRH